MPDSMIPSRDEVADLLNSGDVQKYLNFVPGSGLEGVTNPEEESTRRKFATFKNRGRAIDIHRRVLSKFDFPRRIRKLGVGNEGRWFFIDASGKALKRETLDSMMRALREEKPEAFYDMPVTGDILIKIGRQSGRAVPFTVSKVLKDGIDPDEERLTAGGMQRLVKAVAKDNIITVLPYEDHTVEDAVTKLKGEDIWDVLAKILPDPIPLEASAWIQSPSLKFQRVSDAGEAPAPEPIDVSKIRLGEKQRAHLEAFVNYVVYWINYHIKAYREFDVFGATRDMKDELKTIAKYRDPNFSGINVNSALERTGLQRDADVVRVLESKGLLTFSRGNYDQIHVTLKPEAWAVLDITKPPLPKPMPADKRLTRPQVIRQAVETALKQTASRAQGYPESSQIEVEETATVETSDEHKIMVTYPSIISMPVVTTVNGTDVRYALPEVVPRLYSKTMWREIDKLMNSDEALDTVRDNVKKAKIGSFDIKRAAVSAASRATLDSADAARFSINLWLRMTKGAYLKKFDTDRIEYDGHPALTVTRHVRLRLRPSHVAVTLK